MLMFSPVSPASAAPVYGSRVLVLSQGPSGDWDQAGVSQPAVVASGGLWHMWYTGTDGIASAIGYAISSDGRHWNRIQNKAVTISGAGWSGPAYQPTVVADAPGSFQMWFSGDLVGGSIGRAVGGDGVNWMGASAVLLAGGPGSWDEGGVGEPTVVRDSSGYWMWYAGVDSTGGNASIGLATSPDGVTWAKSLSNPILIPKAGEWFSAGLGAPAAAVLSDGRFILWFSGSDGQTTRIGRVTSMDGVSWTSPELALDVGEPATADGAKTSDPAPSGENADTLWYSGFDRVTWRILLAVPAAASQPASIVTGPTAACAFTFGIGAVGAAAFLRSDRFRYAFHAIPLAFKWVREKNLNSFVRGQIYQYIRENPGDYYSQILKATCTSNGNLVHHLQMLERGGYITNVKEGRLVRFYPKGIPVPSGDGIKYSALQIRLIERIREKPGITQVELAKIMDAKKQTIAYNVWTLAELGVVNVRRVGKDTFLEIIDKKDGEEVEE